MLSTSKCVALYVRVTSKPKPPATRRFFEQNPEVQELPLRRLAEQRGWDIVKVYHDRMSGAKEDRPGLKALMADARRGVFDTLVVWRFDRFARSVKHLVLALEEFHSLGVDFISHQETLDTTTPFLRFRGAQSS